ncbi:MAG: hypothetical protein IKS68_02320 [Mailhella sp.]|nr:hypothetical protein [Mailhella sp.]
MSSAPVNLPFGMGDGPAKVTLVTKQSPVWFAAKCRRRECPLARSPFECPLQKPCAEVSPADWETVSTYEVEEEDNGQSS